MNIYRSNFNNIEGGNPPPNNNLTKVQSQKRTVLALKVASIALIVLAAIAVTALTATGIIGIGAIVAISVGSALTSIALGVTSAVLSRKWFPSQRGNNPGGGGGGGGIHLNPPRTHNFNVYHPRVNHGSNNGFNSNPPRTHYFNPNPPRVNHGFNNGFNNNFNNILNNGNNFNRRSHASIELALGNIEEIPEHVLGKLSHEIGENTTSLSILFNDNNGNRMNGVDAGGLAKHLISALFDSLLKQKKLNPEQYLEQSQEEQELQQQIWTDSGRVIMFSYKSHANRNSFPIGVVFNNEFYSALKALTRDETSRTLNDFFNLNSNLNRLLDLYKILDPNSMLNTNNIKKWLEPINNLNNEDMAEAFTHLSYTLDEDLPDDLRIINLVCEDSDTDKVDQEKLRNNFLAIQEKIKADLKEQITTPLSQLFCIAKGMKALSPLDFSSFSNISSQTLCDRIQGKLTKALVLQSLDFGGYYSGVSQQTQYFLRQWINNAEEQKLKDFVQFITGSTSLAGSARLRVSNHYRSERFCFTHTCSNQIEVPNRTYANYEEFEEMLNTSIEAGLSEGFGVV